MSSHPTPVPSKRVPFSMATYKAVAPRLLGLLKPEMKILLFGMLALLGGSVLNLAFPYVIKVFLDKSSIENLSPHITELTMILVLMFIVQGCFFYARHYYLQLVGHRVVTRLKQQLVSALLHQDVAFFDTSNTGDLISRVTSDTEVVQRGLSINISVVLRYSVQVIGGIALMMMLSVKLSLIILLLIPLIIVMSIFWSKKLRILSKQVQDAIGESGVSVEEALNGIRTVKIFNGEEKENKRFSETIQTALAASTKRIHVAALFSSTMITIMHISIAAVLWFGISAVLKNELSSGDLAAFLLYCTIVAVSFGFLTNAWAEFVQSLGAAERVYAIIDRIPEIQSTKNPKPYLNRGVFEISFNDVSFHYPSRKEHAAIKGINFKLETGKTVALVGPSGSGKSTIAALIPRLYEPTYGTISINGTDIREIALSNLRSHISFVPQTSHLFSASLRYNITYGCSDCSEDQIKAVIDQASLNDLLKRLPERLETQIGDKGVLLSGGEKQRVSIARALLQNPDILILDEATSALDSHNEHAVQEALKNLLKDRTTLIIAHRLSTIQHADEVLVLKEGEIIQRGTHESLIKLNGLYKSMVEYQLL